MKYAVICMIECIFLCIEQIWVGYVCVHGHATLSAWLSVFACECRMGQIWDMPLYVGVHVHAWVYTCVLECGRITCDFKWNNEISLNFFNSIQFIFLIKKIIYKHKCTETTLSNSKLSGDHQKPAYARLLSKGTLVDIVGFSSTLPHFQAYKWFLKIREKSLSNNKRKLKENLREKKMFLNYDFSSSNNNNNNNNNNINNNKTTTTTTIMGHYQKCYRL